MGFDEPADTMRLSKESKTHNLETTAQKSVKKETQAAEDKTQVKYLQGLEFYFQHVCKMLSVGTLITLEIPALDRWQQTDLLIGLPDSLDCSVNSVPV